MEPSKQAKVDNGNINHLNKKYKRIDGSCAIIAYAVLNRYKLEYENLS